MTEPRLSVWPPLSFWTYTRQRVVPCPFPLDQPDARLFRKARHALSAGLTAVGLRAGDGVLVPAYHHGSEIEALCRAGLALSYYDIDERLAPCEDQLERLLAPHVRALYLTHYMGFPQDVVRWRAFCDAHGVLLLEDAAQAWLASIDGRPVGSVGDLSIFCLYKTFGLPDGAALFTAAPVTDAVSDRRPDPGLGALARRHAAWVMSRSGGWTRVMTRLRHDRPYSAVDDFALGDVDSPPASATLHLLARVIDERAAARRRLNYEQLAARLGNAITPLFPDLPDGASPFAFPVLTADKRGLLERLDREGVVGLDVWSVPHPSLPVDQHPSAARLRSSVVALPVHQELRHEDLERISSAASCRPRLRLLGLSITPVDDLADIRSELDDLAAATGNIFWTSDWITLWWQHFGGGHRLATYLCRDHDGAPVAILPLHFARGLPLRVLRFVGHTVSDEMGPIARLRDRPRAIDALRSVLEQLHFEVFLAERLPADERWGSGLGGQRLRSTDSPALQFGHQTWEKVTAAWSPNFRQQIGRKLRKLHREHEVVFRRTTDAAQLDADLDTLFTLHSARWSDQSSFSGGTAPFHRDFAHRALVNGWLRLWILDLDGEPAAAWYGFHFGNAAMYYQAGRDPERARESVGLTLLTHTVREALSDGATEYRFLEGAEPYKYRLANAGSTLDTLAVARGPAGVAAVAAGLVLGQQPRLTKVGHRIVR